MPRYHPPTRPTTPAVLPSQPKYLPTYRDVAYLAFVLALVAWAIAVFIDLFREALS